MSGGRLPAIGARKVIQALTGAGFEVDRIVGSHYVLVYHGDPGRQAGLTVHEFIELL
jgi:predicted RNA binding protein YcfA (HicA-like mRNA interferase family)